MLDHDDPKVTSVSTCFPTHHVQFGFDAKPHALGELGRRRRGQFSAGVNTKLLEETGDELKVARAGPRRSRHQRQRPSAMKGYVQPNQPVRSDQGQAHPGGVLLGSRPNPKGWHDLAAP